MITKQTQDYRRLRRERAALLAVVSDLVGEARDSEEGGMQTYVSLRTVRKAERLIDRIRKGG